ncbi:hypothetical protein PDR5_51040 [Pseudomonas sp. DR 5-09]|nr:hypothetical protein PDR5_51040 [Pseudomonas sp. DR 5-09]
MVVVHFLLFSPRLIGPCVKWCPASSSPPVFAMLARPPGHGLCQKRYKLSPRLYRYRHRRSPLVRQKSRKALICLTCTAVARPLLYAYSKRSCASL